MIPGSARGEGGISDGKRKGLWGGGGGVNSKKNP